MIVKKYLFSFSYVQPSYVIRKFLDSQRLKNLTAYLEKVHEKGMATKEIDTLLLTCYTKLNDEGKILNFTGLDEPLETSSAKTVISANM